MSVSSVNYYDHDTISDLTFGHDQQSQTAPTDYYLLRAYMTLQSPMARFSKLFQKIFKKSQENERTYEDLREKVTTMLIFKTLRKS